MPFSTRYIIVSVLLFSALQAAAQLPMPDKVCVGSGKSYWVDSTANPGSTYTWAIDGTVVQSGTTCSFINTWRSEGTFKLTLRLVSADGCPAELQTGEVIVNPPVGDPEFTKGATSIRRSASETVSYTATSVNSTGIIYSLDDASLAGGNTINPATGEVTFSSNWTGTSVITAIADGCNGPKTATHLVTTTQSEISWNNPADIDYGTLLGDLQLNATADVPGTFEYNPDAGTLLNAGRNQDLSAIFTPADTTNYNTLRKTVIINVNPKPIEIYAGRISKTIGAPDPALTFRCLPPLVSGDSITGSLVRAPGENIGKYPISQGNLSAGNNYSITFYSNDFTITYLPARPIIVTASSGQSKPVGSPDPPNFTYYLNAPLDTGDQLTGALSRLPGETIGGYAITIGTLAGGIKYSITFVSGDFTITGIPSTTITVTATPGQNKMFSEADPVFLFTVDPALAAGDTFTGELSREPGENTGTYPITPGNLSAVSKYTINFISSDFTITPYIAIPITVTADAGQGKVFGDVDPVLTYSVNPISSGAVFTGKPARGAGENVVGNPYEITRGTLDAGRNYRITFVPAGFDINPKPITVTADSKTKTAGDPDPVFTYVCAPGLLNGDQFTGSLTRAPGESPGRYPIKLATLSAGSNYEITYVSDQLIITSGNATPVITWTNPGDIIFGTQLTALQLNATADVPGIFEYNPGFGSLLNAGLNQTLSVRFFPDDTARYNSASASVKINIHPKPITIKADSLSKIYGDADPVLTYTWYTELIADDSITGALERDPGENAGSYSVNQGTLFAGSNYEITYISDLFTITPAALIITADNKTKPFGAPIPDLTFTYSGLKNRDSVLAIPVAISTIATVLSNPGDYPITVCCAADPNYTITYIDGTLTITRGMLTPFITWADPGDIIYGTPLTAVQLNATADVPGKFEYTPGFESLLNAGLNQTLSVRFFPDDTARYNSASASVRINVHPKPITIKADAVSKIYGDTDPVITYTRYTELITDDSITGALERDPGENAGSYSVNQGTLFAGSNYEITYISDLFVITPASLIITADNKTKPFGAPIPDLTFTYSGLKNRDSGLINPPSISTLATALSNPGDYTITVCCAADPNYTITYIDGTLTITLGMLTPFITWADPADIIYGTPLTILQLNATADVPGRFDYTPSFETMLNAGPDQILSVRFTPDDTTKNNSASASVKINVLRKPINITAVAKSKVYDGTTLATLLTCYCTGVAEGDTVIVSGGTASFDTPSAGSGKIVTATGFILTGSDAGNYRAIVIATTTANIYPLAVPASLTVNANSFEHLSDQITLTAAVQGGAPLAGGAPAVSSVTFTFEGNVIKDAGNNSNIEMAILDSGLVATLTLSLQELPATGQVISGTREVVAIFNEVSDNYAIGPNPAKTTFTFDPGLDIRIFPNPLAGPDIRFQLTLPVSSMVIIDLFAPNGQLINRIFKGYLTGGESKTIVFSHNLPQGIYLYQIRTDNQIINGRIIVIREY